MLPQARFSDKPALLRSISNYPNTLKTTYTLNTLTTPVQVSDTQENIASWLLICMGKHDSHFLQKISVIISRDNYCHIPQFLKSKVILLMDICR